MGLSVMCVTHVASAVIILAFKLEDIGDGEVTMSQTVAGYFVLVLQCLFLGSATLSVGYALSLYSIGKVLKWLSLKSRLFCTT